MPTTVDYKAIFECMPLPSAVCTPIFTSSNEIKDIHIDAVNNQFSTVTKNTIKTDSLYSEIKDNLTPDLDWLALAQKALSAPVEKAFYSLVAKTHLKITASKTSDGKIVLCLTDIAKEKETEQQLRRQNSRLEELTAKL